jgi:hypothetical protein
MQFASWCCVTSLRIDTVTTAQRCIRHLNTIDRHPALPRSPYFSESDLEKHAAVLERVGSWHLVIGGHVAIQKRLRQLVAMVPFPKYVHVTIFHVTMKRFLKLTRQVEHSSQNQQKDHTISGQASTDLVYEWQNIMNMMAVGGREWVDLKEAGFPEHISPLLPLPLEAQQR